MIEDIATIVTFVQIVSTDIPKQLLLFSKVFNTALHEGTH